MNPLLPVFMFWWPWLVFGPHNVDNRCTFCGQAGHRAHACPQAAAERKHR